MNFHQIHPPIPRIAPTKNNPSPKPLCDWAAGSTGGGGVAVGEGVADGLGEGVMVAGPGVNVAVGGGVTISNSF